MLDPRFDRYLMTTAEILYRLPDFPDLLQTYLWQQFDLAPEFPALAQFLVFWQRNLDGKLHSVKVSAAPLMRKSEFAYANHEFAVQ